MLTLGISAFYHDSAVALFKNGKLIAAAEEERFTGIKHDSSFPYNALDWVLQEGRVKSIKDINLVCWYENPIFKEDRVKESLNKYFFRTLFSKKKILRDLQYKNNPFVVLKDLGFKGDIRFVPHHFSHASFSYFTSNYNEAAILTVDGVGEKQTAVIYKAQGNKLEEKFSIDFPNSLGLLYSTVTAYLGFKPNEGEYKIMGLAPYGNPEKYFDKLEQVFFTTSNKFFINQKYFTWEYSRKKMFNRKFGKLLNIPPRLPEEEITQEHKDLAAGLQKLYEREFLRLVKTAKHITKSDNLCLGGGCAYNGVANTKAYKYFTSIHIPFAPSDSGSAIGAVLNKHTNISPYLGPSFSNSETKAVLTKFENRLSYFKLDDERLVSKTSELLASRKIVAWFQGRMEFGARALGNRSILADPRLPWMRERLNTVIKKRELFRPFAPAVMEEYSRNLFKLKEPVPYMNQVVEARTKNIPSATHIDGTCRVQTVSKEQNYLFYKLLEEFQSITNVPVLLNTSFNFKDQTITLSPHQAISRFLNSDIDVLVINNYLIFKNGNKIY